MSDTVHKVADQTASAVSPVSAGLATSDVAAEQPAVVAPETETAAAPATATTAEEPKVDAVAPTEETKTEAAPAAAAEKAVEPITEGQLAYKGPGLVKSLIPSKKEFWLSDAAVTPQNLELYTRGEKPDIAHPIVAWASQTGRGLLFFNKKGETEKTRPHDVLALYDATDLKKESPHQFAFKLNGHNHTFKATSDAERDGWYLSIEKAIELGKASKEEIRGGEGYKSEFEKLSKPAAAAAAVAGAGAAAAASKPKKSVEVDRAVAPARVGSDAEEETTTDKKKKSRSTSRGILNRLQGKKEEVEQKAVEKKEAKEEAKEEKKIEKEEAKDAEPAADVAAPAVAAAAVAEAPAAAATEEKPVEPVTEAKTEEKPKPAKRGSIFGKLPTGWGSFKSPSKEKDQKEAELKPEEASKDAVVSENPPVLPETATTTEPTVEPVVPAVEEPVAEAKTEAPKETAADVITPGKEKKNFLSGFGGFIKRDRSVSPSTNFKDQAKKEETPAAPAAVEEASEPVVAKPEEPIAEPVAATEAAPVEATEATADKPVEKVEEPKTETAAPNKRQSVFGTLGRRASKAFRGIASPRKETAPTTEAKEETAATADATKATEETPAVNGETKAAVPEAEAAPQQSIGDVVPEAVNVGQPQHTTSPTVTASA